MPPQELIRLTPPRRHGGNRGTAKMQTPILKTYATGEFRFAVCHDDYEISVTLLDGDGDLTGEKRCGIIGGENIDRITDRLAQRILSDVCF